MSDVDIAVRIRDIERIDGGWEVDLVIGWRFADPESTDPVDRSIIVVVRIYSDDVVGWEN